MFRSPLKRAEYPVAPLAGAWIETMCVGILYLAVYVAPLAGAWIETIRLRIRHVAAKSRPSRARGLKR